jgi:predicted RNase H-like HicB family nuclease
VPAFTSSIPFYRRASGPDRGMEAVTVTLLLQQERETWVGVCHELGTSAYAASFEEALGELKEAVALQLSEIDRLGFLVEYLKDRQVPVVLLKEGDEGDWVPAELSTPA